LKAGIAARACRGRSSPGKKPVLALRHRAGRVLLTASFFFTPEGLHLPVVRSGHATANPFLKKTGHPFTRALRLAI
jgi:hypothetical protein